MKGEKSKKIRWVKGKTVQRYGRCGVVGRRAEKKNTRKNKESPSAPSSKTNMHSTPPPKRANNNNNQSPTSPSRSSPLASPKNLKLLQNNKDFFDKDIEKHIYLNDKNHLINLNILNFVSNSKYSFKNFSEAMKNIFSMLEPIEFILFVIRS